MDFEVMVVTVALENPLLYGMRRIARRIKSRYAAGMPDVRSKLSNLSRDVLPDASESAGYTL